MNTSMTTGGLLAAASAAALTTTASLLMPSPGAAAHSIPLVSQTTQPPASFATAEESDVVGTIVSLAPDGSSLVVAIQSIAYPSGKVVEFDAPRSKRVVIASTTEMQSADAMALPLTTADLLPGRTVHVITANPGEPGASVTARAVRAVVGGSGGAPLPGNTFKAAGLVRQHNLAPQFFLGGEGGDTRTIWLSNISLVAE